MNELVKSLNIAELVAQRNAIVEKLTAAIELLCDAEVMAKSAGIKCPKLEIPAYCDAHPMQVSDRHAVSRVRAEIDISAWGLLAHKSGMRTFMDAATRQRFDKGLTDVQTVPVLTTGTIEATFKHLHNTRGAMFEAGVIRVFQGLSSGFKTNTPMMFGSKIILTHLSRFRDGVHYFDSDTCNKLDDLTRVFYVLDEKPEPDHRDGAYSRFFRGTQIEDDYTRVKAFKKGTGHVEFKRPDLVERMNTILSRHFPNAIAAV